MKKKQQQKLLKVSMVLTNCSLSFMYKNKPKLFLLFFQMFFLFLIVLGIDVQCEAEWADFEFVYAH